MTDSQTNAGVEWVVDAQAAAALADAIKAAGRDVVRLGPLDLHRVRDRSTGRMGRLRGVLVDEQGEARAWYSELGGVEFETAVADLEFLRPRR